MEDAIRLALAEDLQPAGDVTSGLLFERDARIGLHLRARERGTMSGSMWGRAVYGQLGSDVEVGFEVPDGGEFAPGQCLARLSGSARDILAGERLFLNLVQRACSVASMARRYAGEVAGTGVRILDTRKTSPCWRQLDRGAVVDGGCHNHRFNLSTGILIKDNHVAALGSLRHAVELARHGKPHLTEIEAEVDSLEQVSEALDAGVDAILLDNFSVEACREAVALVGGQALCEASGGIHLGNVRDYARTGVDAISVGALTQSPPTVDLGLDYDAEDR